MNILKAIRPALVTLTLALALLGVPSIITEAGAMAPPPVPGETPVYGAWETVSSCGGVTFSISMSRLTGSNQLQRVRMRVENQNNFRVHVAYAISFRSSEGNRWGPNSEGRGLAANSRGEYSLGTPFPVQAVNSTSYEKVTECTVKIIRVRRFEDDSPDATIAENDACRAGTINPAQPGGDPGKPPPPPDIPSVIEFPGPKPKPACVTQQKLYKLLRETEELGRQVKKRPNDENLRKRYREKSREFSVTKEQCDAVQCMSARCPSKHTQRENKSPCNVFGDCSPKKIS